MSHPLIMINEPVKRLPRIIAEISRHSIGDVCIRLHSAVSPVHETVSDEIYPQIANITFRNNTTSPLMGSCHCFLDTLSCKEDETCQSISSLVKYISYTIA